MTTIAGTNPHTGEALPAVTEPTTTTQVDVLARSAGAAASAYAALSRHVRAEILDEIGAAVEANRGELVDTACTETGFAAAKLDQELTRAAYQFRFFAEVIRDGGYLEAAIDHAGDTPMGPRPDLRRILVPVGPVAVFGASNFPFAFSVLGGDTASALAAGSPVIVKAHGSHPATSQLSFEILDAVVTASAAPDATIGIVYGTSAGSALVAHPAMSAVGFTGSLSGGEALLDIIGHRDAPIPFYGELSSLNPVLVTPRAAGERAGDIGAAMVASFTLGSGQLCTKPGFVLIPDGPAGDEVMAAARAALAEVTPGVLLNERIHADYAAALRAIDRRPETADDDAGFSATPTLVETSLHALSRDLVHEVFGPLAVAVRYPAADVVAAARHVFGTFPASLTATLHIGADEDDAVLAQLTELASRCAGRIVYNGFPTGVAVSWAQTHGGPWPSTNSLHTSVGATAIRRFLRPITLQDAPAAVLPDELQDGYAAIPRRIDGVLRVSGQSGR